MKMIKGLIVAATTLMLSSFATAAPEADAALMEANMRNVQTVSFWNENQYCSMFPQDCYCEVILGRKYCKIL